MPGTEYHALRATVRQRGTARMLLVPALFVGWAGVVVATAAVIAVALSTLVPLLVLAAGFESVFALHVNVERIGRYIEVFHEAPGSGWEHAASAFGRQVPEAVTDALFTRVFILATSVNFFPAALGGEPWEVVIVAGCHFAFIYRIRRAQRYAGRQRHEDLINFTALRDTAAASSSPEQIPLDRRPTE